MDPRRTSPGRGIANPYAAILSAALLLRYALQLGVRGARLETAVSRAIDVRRADRRIWPPPAPRVTTRAAADAVLAGL